MVSNTDLELSKLEAISKESLYSAGVMGDAIKYCFQIMQRFSRGHAVLELGPAEGVMTELLVKSTKDLTVVEGSLEFCLNLRKRFPTAQVVHSLFETFRPDSKYDFIVLGHVLEHVENPVILLERIRNWLKPDGRIFAAVPNSRSIHRQAAVLMGMLPIENALNEKDRHHGHRIVFDPESFRGLFNQAGLSIEVFGGYWLKPLANSQIEATWTPDMIEAFMKLGERYPDIAAEIYVIAK